MMSRHCADWAETWAYDSELLSQERKRSTRLLVDNQPPGRIRQSKTSRNSSYFYRHGQMLQHVTAPACAHDASDSYLKKCLISKRHRQSGRNTYKVQSPTAGRLVVGQRVCRFDHSVGEEDQKKGRNTKIPGEFSCYEKET